MACTLPKLAPKVIERRRFTRWLAAHAHAPVRYVVAPAGSGKTTSVTQYANARRNDVTFVTLPPETGERELIELIATALDRPEITGYAELTAELASRSPHEVIIDNCDHAVGDARTLLTRIFGDVPDDVTFIYLAQSVDAVPLSYARAQGFVEVCDSLLLAFSPEAAQRYATTLGIRASESELARLTVATHGWAIAVSGACRTALAAGVSVADGLLLWRLQNAAALDELAMDAMLRVAPVLAAAFNDVVRGRAVADVPLLEAFRSAGLFTTTFEGRLALNPLVCAESAATAIAHDPCAPAVIEMFGRFEMTIGGKPVVWIRRRDRQIVQYLATLPDARASRAQLISVFWPDVDRQLAGQSLRSACSTIRRAIAACVGREAVDTYFLSDADLGLALDRTLISTRRFTALVESGDDAYARGDIAEAFVAYRAAEVLYRAPLLAGEEATSWAESAVRHYAALMQTVTARLEELSRALEAHDVSHAPAAHRWLVNA